MNGWIVRCRPAAGTFAVRCAPPAEHLSRPTGEAVVSADAGADRLAVQVAEPTPLESPSAVAAAARWLPAERRLEVVRDRTGQQPVFYTELADGTLVATTDLRALAREDGVRLAPASDALAAWLEGRTVKPNVTLIDKVFRVPAGHRLTYDTAAGVSLRPDWRPPPPGTYAAREAARFGQLLEAAVARHARLGRPAIFLSGGIDSAAVAAACASNGSALALCIEFEGASEAPTQHAVADALGLPTLQARAAPGEELVRRALERARNSLWPTLAPWAPIFDGLAEQARSAKGAGVLLDGIGGDELLDAGYAAGRALLARRPWALPAWLLAERRYTGSTRGSLRSLAARRSRRSYAEERTRDLVDAELAAQREETFDFGQRTGLARRHPLWDAEVVDLLHGLPPHALVGGGHPKGPARSYLRRTVPTVGGAWPRPRVADALARDLESLLRDLLDTHGAPNLHRLGLVHERFSGSTLPFGRLWRMLSLEYWLDGLELWGRDD